MVSVAQSPNIFVESCIKISIFPLPNSSIVWSSHGFRLTNKLPEKKIIVGLCLHCCVTVSTLQTTTCTVFTDQQTINFFPGAWKKPFDFTYLWCMFNFRQILKYCQSVIKFCKIFLLSRKFCQSITPKLAGQTYRQKEYFLRLVSGLSMYEA